MEQTGTGPATGEGPFYSRGSFWTGPFMWGLGATVALALAVGWYALGGLPGDHDEYGEVAVPGAAVIELPEGDVRLNFENSAHRSGDSTTLDDQPPGLAVAVTPAGGGDEVEVDDVPSWLFSSTSGDRGHEPFGKIDVPNDGNYLVAASADGEPAPPPPKLATIGEPPSVDAGPAVSFGKAPWTPLDSRFLGAVLVFVVVMLATLLFTLPFRLIGRRG